MDQLESQLKAADVVLTGDVLDRIDEAVAPGHTISRQDVAFEPQALRKKDLRRIVRDGRNVA
jgi:aryl-alcohol dehydrogenase (NADP+)